MLAGTDLSTIKASDVFGFLPPVGMLPVGSATRLTTTFSF
jgi:hypothetical protein